MLNTVKRDSATVVSLVSRINFVRMMNSLVGSCGIIGDPGANKEVIKVCVK